MLRILPLHEAVAYLKQLIEEDSDNEQELQNKGHLIYIQPPDNDYDSGGDDADEREGGLVSDVHFNQLNAYCEINVYVPDTTSDDKTEEQAMDVDIHDEQQKHRSSTVASTSKNKTASFSAPKAKTPWKYMGKHIDVCDKSKCPNTKTKFKYDKKSS